MVLSIAGSNKHLVYGVQMDRWDHGSDYFIFQCFHLETSCQVVFVPEIPSSIKQLIGFASPPEDNVRASECQSVRCATFDRADVLLEYESRGETFNTIANACLTTISCFSSSFSWGREFLSNLLLSKEEFIKVVSWEHSNSLLDFIFIRLYFDLEVIMFTCWKR